MRWLCAVLLSGNLLRYGVIYPFVKGVVMLPVEFSTVAYFLVPAILLTSKRRLRSWAAYSGLMAGFFYYLAMIAAGGVIYGVPGGAGLMDATVSAVIRRAAEEKLDWRVIPGVGLYERAAAEAGALDGANVLAAIDVTEDTVIDVRRPLVVCEVSDRMAASDLKLSLMEHYP